MYIIHEKFMFNSWQLYVKEIASTEFILYHEATMNQGVRLLDSVFIVHCGVLAGGNQRYTNPYTYGLQG